MKTTRELLPTDDMRAIIAEAAARLRAPVVEETPPEIVKKKKCSDCGEQKPLNDFYRDSKIRKDGRKNICKACWSIKYGKRP